MRTKPPFNFFVRKSAFSALRMQRQTAMAGSRLPLPAQHRLYLFVVADIGVSTLAKLSTRQELATG